MISEVDCGAGRPLFLVAKHLHRLWPTMADYGPLRLRFCRCLPVAATFSAGQTGNFELHIMSTAHIDVQPVH